jgi:hypothetical protein
MANSFLGGPLDLGPCNLYWDCASGSAYGTDGLNLGGVDQVTFRFGVEKTDLVTAQNGTDPADRVVTATMCEIECGLAEATLERLAAIFQGFETVSSGGTIVGATFGASIGERDSSIVKEMRLVRIIDGAESTEPLDEVRVFKVAPASNAELVYDAASQRFIGTLFKAYRQSTITSPTGKPTFFGIGQFVV